MSIVKFIQLHKSGDKHTKIQLEIWLTTICEFTVKKIKNCQTYHYAAYFLSKKTQY